MSKKIAFWVSGTGSAIGLVASFFAHATTIAAGALNIPTSTVQDLLASVSNIYSDPGVLGLFIVAVAIPLAFVLLHYAKGLLPGSRARIGR